MNVPQQESTDLSREPGREPSVWLRDGGQRRPPEVEVGGLLVGVGQGQDFRFAVQAAHEGDAGRGALAFAAGRSGGVMVIPSAMAICPPYVEIVRGRFMMRE